MGFGVGSTSGSGGSLAFPITVAQGGTGRTDGTLYDNAGTPAEALDFYQRFLVSGGKNVIDWSLQRGYDNAGLESYNWRSRQTFDGAGTPRMSLDWNARALYYTDGATKIVDWLNAKLTDTSNKLSVNWLARKLYTADGVTLVYDWLNYVLYDASGVTAINHTSRVLNTDPAGTSSGQWTHGGMAPAPYALTISGGLVATNAIKGNHFTLTATGNFTLSNPTNPVGGQKITWAITQDATGGRIMTLDTAFSFGADITTAVLSTIASKTDYLSAIYNSTAGKWHIIGFLRGY